MPGGNDVRERLENSAATLQTASDVAYGAHLRLLRDDTDDGSRCTPDVLRQANRLEASAREVSSEAQRLARYLRGEED